MRRTKRDLTYLVETTTAEETKDTALFGDRGVRLAEHGWRESKFGETTKEGCELAELLREHAEETYRWETSITIG